MIDMPDIKLDPAFAADQMIAVVENSLADIRIINRNMRTDLKNIFYNVPNELKEQIYKEFLNELKNKKIPIQKVKFYPEDM